MILKRRTAGVDSKAKKVPLTAARDGFRLAQLVLVAHEALFTLR